jgi:hypothetical protein
MTIHCQFDRMQNPADHGANSVPRYVKKDGRFR